MTVPEEEAPANYVPAAAVILRERSLSGITGRKAFSYTHLIAEMPLLAAVLGALFVGVGAGLCVRAGGAPSGDDALAMSICQKFRWDIRWAYLLSDLIVLGLSLTYLDIGRIGLSLLTVVLSGQIIGIIQKIGQKKEADSPEEEQPASDIEPMEMITEEDISAAEAPAEDPLVAPALAEQERIAPEAMAPHEEEVLVMEQGETSVSYTHLDVYKRQPDAERVVVAMGSVCDTIETVVDELMAKGEKVGMVKVRLYRPFATQYFLDCLPKTVKRIAVMDRVKTPGAPGEPLFMDVMSAFYGSANAPLVIGGRYGLGSKDTIPADIEAVFTNLAADQPKHNFTISIVDDVTNLSLPRPKIHDILPKGTIQCKFWGLGSDGTVGANKQAVDIIGTHTDMHAQAYFDYDSKKSGGLTISHLRFGNKEIKAPYLINQADFIS